MLKKLISLGVVAGIASLAVLDANPANAASLSFEFYYNESEERVGDGTFEGFDNDGDDFLRLDELTSFYVNFFNSAYEVTLSDLSSFGSFNLNSQVWNADASGWGIPTGFYLSWGEGYYAVSSDIFTPNILDYQPSTQTPADVPEPGTVGALALMGVSGLLTKRKLSKCSA